MGSHTIFTSYKLFFPKGSPTSRISSKSSVMSSSYKCIPSFGKP
nr:MAG TPA: hypothetical protein [Bacteriophage sp.]